jgi:hypothetical protein
MYATANQSETLSMQRVSSTFGLTLILALKCAHAQNLHALQACTHLGDDAARLSCYDAAMGRSKSATPPSAAVDTQQQATFGDDGGLHTKADTPLPKHLSARVREAVPLPAGLYRLTLDNGQVWNTTQADSALAFKSNDAITISRGWLGSYYISLTGRHTSISVARVQ